ncbi:uncharacterized protein LOC133382812 isoform X2 [Rhineura floridana]|uniref:uncharacterized protein LOC133382812 isoform X2 n=1 Tax=Rhineura floridana TaxID=261503 RepID=UPI002AC80CBF|nr:uncharacterized protein LOC133382812 isoform X2 [Rhineura floridana]
MFNGGIGQNFIMKLLFPLMLFRLLFFCFLLGKDTTNLAARVLQTPNLDVVKRDEWANTTLDESQELTPELGFPWLLLYLPIKSCHVIFWGEAGTFSPPVLSRIQTNSWCNWTIWAGPHKHILIYIEGFEGKSECEGNQDKIIFQGVLSSVESKVIYACRNHGTLIFATQAVAVHVVFLSTASSQNHNHKHFKGRYYIFEDYEISTGDEGSVLKSNNSVGFSPKSYIINSQDILDFVKTSRKLSNEKGLPATIKDRWEENGSTTSLEASTRPTASLLKTTENLTLKPLDMKKMHIAKPPINGTRIGNETLSGNLKKTLVLGSSNSENAEKLVMYKPTASSASPHVSQKVRMVAKLVAAKDHGTTTESANVQNSGHNTTNWGPTNMRDTIKAIFGISAFTSGNTFPQEFMQEQKTPIPSPKTIPEKKQEHIHQSFQSNSEYSRKSMDEMESQQHFELQEALKGEQVENQFNSEENGNSALHKASAAAVGENVFHEVELLTAEVPNISTAKAQSHLNTFGYPNVLHAPSQRMVNSNHIGTTSTTTLDLQAVHSNSTQMGTAVTSQLNNSVTRYKEHPQKRRTKPNPSRSPSDQVSSHETSLNAEIHFYDRDSVSRSHENYSVLESQHNPGDLLFEISFGIEHKGWIPPVGSELEKDLIDSIKSRVEKKVKLFSNKIKEVKLKEIKREGETEMERQNGPNLIFMFWLHLTPEEKNISHLLHLQLEDLSGASMGPGKVQTVVVKDVNECNSGIGLCGDEATCLNGYGTYLCQCKEEYEDHSSTKSGTLCIRSPRSANRGTNNKKTKCTKEQRSENKRYTKSRMESDQVQFLAQGSSP